MCMTGADNFVKLRIRLFARDLFSFLIIQFDLLCSAHHPSSAPPFSSMHPPPTAPVPTTPYSMQPLLAPCRGTILDTTFLGTAQHQFLTLCNRSSLRPLHHPRHTPPLPPAWLHHLPPPSPYRSLYPQSSLQPLKKKI